MVDPHDNRGVPVSTAIPPLVRAAAILGLLIVFAVGGMVISQASYGHVWPAKDSVTIKLPANVQASF